jgi:transcription initiation factor TFIID subunit TAF12
MLDSMQAVVKLGVEMTTEERNLLSVAFKNVTGARRSAWRILAQMEEREQQKQPPQQQQQQQQISRAYRVRIEGELDALCTSCIGVVETYALPSNPSSEAQVFLLKVREYELVWNINDT